MKTHSSGDRRGALITALPGKKGVCFFVKPWGLPLIPLRRQWVATCARAQLPARSWAWVAGVNTRIPVHWPARARDQRQSSPVSCPGLKARIFKGVSPVQIHDDGRKFSCHIVVRPDRVLRSSTTVKVFGKSFCSLESLPCSCYCLQILPPPKMKHSVS